MYHCCSGEALVLHIPSVGAYSLKYPACNANAPYFHLWPALLYNIFPPYLIKNTIFEKKKKIVTEHKMCVGFYLRLLSETLLVLRRTERDMIKNVYWSSCEVPLFLSDCNQS